MWVVGLGREETLDYLNFLGVGEFQRAKFLNLEVIGCPAKFSFNSVGYIYNIFWFISHNDTKSLNFQIHLG